MRNSTSFFRRFSRILHLCWIASCGNALYILRYILTIVSLPGEAMSAGMRFSAVHGMTEHVLMSMTLLLLGGICAQILHRSFMK